MVNPTQQSCKYVYGPVNSWRYGRSLGIDPIGLVSTCSFDCVYCQLGEIEQKTEKRQFFVPSVQISEDLQAHFPWSVDVITLSGSGEPTLALNLEEIIVAIKKLTEKPVVVLTNGTLLHEPTVRQQLSLADRVSVKLDAVDPKQLQRINKPVNRVNLDQMWSGLQQFRFEFTGKLSIQTMVMFPWNYRDKRKYIDFMRSVRPDEIQLNTPTRPKPLKHQLDARGNLNRNDSSSLGDRVKILRRVSTEILQAFAAEIYESTGICVRFPTKAV